MRQECKHFESRTYHERRDRPEVQPRPGAGRAVALPGADCPKFERRLADVSWEYGTLVTPATPPEPPGLDDGSAAAVLDEAEEIINSIGPQVLADVEARQGRAGRGWRRCFGRRLPRRAGPHRICTTGMVEFPSACGPSLPLSPSEDLNHVSSFSVDAARATVGSGLASRAPRRRRRAVLGMGVPDA